MKKIDLHIHTVKSLSDYDFEYKFDELKKYVFKLKLDCIAITNHNLFDLEQFKEISSQLNDITVLPGIEINLEGGHLLLISDNKDLEDFNTKCSVVKSSITSKNDSITVEELTEIFIELNKYLLIPHYEKEPVIKEEIIKKLQQYISAGEVSSIPKFKSCMLNSEKLVPVIFSDARIGNLQKDGDTIIFPTKQTYIDIEEISLNGIKFCLSDKNKVFLSENEGNDLFQVTDDGLFISTGLNVMLGERSSGKSHTLNKICKSSENAKYIEQFALLQNDGEKFNSDLSLRQDTITELFLKEFKDIILDVKEIDSIVNRNLVGNYIDTLLKFASESDKLDNYAKSALFSESLFKINDLNSLKSLIDATILIIEDSEYQEIVNKHLIADNLKKLAIELIIKHNDIHNNNLEKLWLNTLISSIKQELNSKTTIVFPEEIDFYKILFENEKLKKFDKIVKDIQKDKIINKKEFRGFKVVGSAKKFKGAHRLQTTSKTKLSFSEAFEAYEVPIKYLKELKKIGLPESTYYKYFVDIEYKTLNKYNVPVSGGERSEFNLLHEIHDALKYDLLLIDEPESSFDNLFLKNDVNELIKDISKQIPVVIVTHNSTVGASIKPEFLIYTRKEIINNEVHYYTFSGHPTSKNLKGLDGNLIDKNEVLLSCLEAGKEAYEERRRNIYDVLKN